MVQVNNKNNEITIKVSGDTSDLVQMQRALIDLLQHYDFKGFGRMADETYYYSLELLEALLPDYDQQHRGIIRDEQYLELPSTISPLQARAIREAVKMIHNPELQTRPDRNPVHEALKSLEI